MATTAAAKNPTRNWFYDIQQKIYSFQEKFCGQCSTDNKIYAFLILGRVLQAAAILTFGASIAFAFTAGPIALLATIPAIAMGVLGTFAVGNPQEFNEMLQIARPFVPGQPIGLMNVGNNCWLNSSLQLLTNTPAFHARMRQIPQLSDFLNAYQVNGDSYQKVARNIDTNVIRQFLSRETGGLISESNRQEDAAQFFEYFFQGQHAIHRLDQHIDQGDPIVRREPLLQINLGESSRPSFQELFNSYFDHSSDLGQRIQLFFQRAPIDLFVQANRFYQRTDTSGALQQGKIVDPIDIPERLALPNRFIRSGENAEYLCDGFSIHNGSSLDGGHYVCYVKRQDKWWYCSDTTVYEVAKGQALDAMKHGYLFHFAKAN